MPTIRAILNFISQLFCRHNALNSEPQVAVVYCSDCGWLQWYKKDGDFFGWLRNQRKGRYYWSDKEG